MHDFDTIYYYYDDWSTTKKLRTILDNYESRCRERVYDWLMEDIMNPLKEDFRWTLGGKRHYLRKEQLQQRIHQSINAECRRAINYMNQWSTRSLPFKGKYEEQKYIEIVVWNKHIKNKTIPPDIQNRIDQHIAKVKTKGFNPFVLFCMDFYAELDSSIDDGKEYWLSCFENYLKFLLSSYREYRQFMDYTSSKW